MTPYRLWIGSERDSRNPDAARRHGVHLIVNCTKNLPFKVPDVDTARVPVDDHPDQSDVMVTHLPRVVATIDKHLNMGHGVLVHCYAGVSRSASVVAAFLMYKEGLTPRQAINRVKKLKPETFQNGYNFLPALQSYHAFLKELNATRTRGKFEARRSTHAPRSRS